MSTAESEHLLSLYPQRSLNIVRGEGALLFDDQGNQFIDCISGQGVVNIGHAHPRLVEAVQHQVSQLTTLPMSFPHAKRGELCAKVSQLAPGDLGRVFLCNSGAESVEAALKFSKLATGRTKFVSLMRSFHGRTHGALSVTYNPKYREPFLPLSPGCEYIPAHSIEKLDRVLTDEVAAIILEPIQGEGGVYPLEAEFVAAARRISRERGVMLIADEIQAGVGRTGTFFASEHYDLEPDFICLAKGLGGGLPIGAVVAHKDFAVKPGMHGTTFGGNPLVCAAACVAVDIVSAPEFLEDVRSKGEFVFERLSKLEASSVKEVRGQGLMIGIQLSQKVAPYLSALQERGVLALAAGPTVLRLLPPLVISREELADVLDSVESVLKG